MYQKLRKEVKMSHKLSSAIFAQGWIESQIENMLTTSTEKSNEDPTSHLVASQVSEQWNIVSQTMDDLIAENGKLRRALELAKSGIELGLST
jgi:hypothetical protein